MSRHNFLDYESSDTISRYASIQNQTAVFSMQGQAPTEKPKTIYTQTGSLVIAPVLLSPEQREKARHNKLKYFRREYDRLRVKDLINTL